MTDQLAIIRRLERERDEAREQVAQLLESFAGLSWQPPRSLRLTPRETELLCVLVRRRGVVSMGQLHQVMIANRIKSDHPDPKLVAVYICKLRKKLAPLGCSIETHWGHGFCLPNASREILITMERRASA